MTFLVKNDRPAIVDGIAVAWCEAFVGTKAILEISPVTVHHYTERESVKTHT